MRALPQIRALVHTWLLLDFFGDSRRIRAAGGTASGSSLTTTIMWQALLSFAFAMLLYPDTAPIPFAAANLCLSTLLITAGALGDEQHSLRVAADEHLLAGSPVARLTVIAARVGHASFHLLLVTTGMALAPAILLAHLTASPWQGIGYVVSACACTALAGGTMGTLRVVVARLFGNATATLTTGSAKAMLLGGGFVMFALALRLLDETADALPIGRLGAELLPPYHAARLLADPGAEWWRVPVWCGFAVLLVALSALLRAPNGPARSRGMRRSLLQRQLARLTDRGPRRGLAEFVALSMWRSAGFRARVLPLLGLPAGMVFLTLGEEGAGDDFMLVCLLLQLPAIYLPFLIAFLPRADQAGTAWIFDHAPTVTRELVHDATWRALTTHVLVPTFVLAAALLIGFGPDRLDRAAAAAFAFGLAVLAAERMIHLDRVPFTQERELEGGIELGMLMTSALVLGTIGTGFGAAPANLRWPLAGAAVLMAVLRLRRRPPIGEATMSSLDAGPTAAAGAAESPVDDLGQEPKAFPESGIGRELRAILVLYAVLCVLPWAAGAAFLE